jgi:hypothetical protein
MCIRRIFANIPTLITPATPCPFLGQGTAYTWVKFRRSLPSKLGQLETIVNTVVSAKIDFDVTDENRTDDRGDAQRLSSRL